MQAVIVTGEDSPTPSIGGGGRRSRRLEDGSDGEWHLDLLERESEPWQVA